MNYLSVLGVTLSLLLSCQCQRQYQHQQPAVQYNQEDSYSYQSTQPPPQILSHKQALNHDGNFKYLFTSENGLAQGESIAPDGSRNGGYSYVDPNGKKISVKYTAGKEGFRILEADHLPKAPQPVVPLPVPVQQPAYQPQYQPQPQQYQPRAYPQYNKQEDDGQYRPELYERPQQQLIQQNNFTKCLICSDSKSALEKITRSSYKAAIDSQTLQLKQKLCEFDEQHREIKFAWIPSHTGIIGNDRADHLANLGRKLPISEEPKASFKDFQIKYKENLWIGWENRFQQIGQAKGITYCSQVTVPYKKAWFTKFPNLGRGIITQMCRMRSGHCSVPVHLFRLKVVNSNQCLCGSVGTLQHVLLECTRFQRESQLLRRELEGDPTLTDVLFKNLNSKTLIAVQKFLTSTVTRV
ncbi:uncharacterized protein LOC126879253 isoform X1 [Diabrotica virgifera virgifera]|uniref:RNase H type-1 domain-containing protein n=2 Tax=Diabrotica virgifera virgifera TaxID=50390 RepID=A0ABM5JK14_DIAVI|nr:uncharacterized protein LOC126879253 isoform X1 [Diabrotica virgifera virgifera]